MLGETSDPGEVFLVDSCGDVALAAVTGKVHVQHRPTPHNWKQLGGSEEDVEPEMDEEGKYFFQKWYDPDTARFEDPPMEYLEKSFENCCSCVRMESKVITRAWLSYPLAVLCCRIVVQLG